MMKIKTRVNPTVWVVVDFIYFIFNNLFYKPGRNSRKLHRWRVSLDRERVPELCLVPSHLRRPLNLN